MTELILALDVTDRKKALAISHECAPYIDAIKLGYPLILSCGLSITQDLESGRSSPHCRFQGCRYPKYKPAHCRTGF